MSAMFLLAVVAGGAGCTRGEEHCPLLLVENVPGQVLRPVQEQGIGIPLTDVVHEALLRHVDSPTWHDGEPECNAAFTSDAPDITSVEQACFDDCVDRVRQSSPRPDTLDWEIQSLRATDDLESYCIDGCIDEPDAVAGIRRICPSNNGIFIGHDAAVQAWRRHESFTLTRLPPDLTAALSTLLRGVVLGFGGNLEIATPISRDQLSCAAEGAGRNESGFGVRYACDAEPGALTADGVGGYLRRVEVCPVVHVARLRDLGGPGALEPDAGTCEWWRRHRHDLLGDTRFAATVGSHLVRLEANLDSVRLWLRNYRDDVLTIDVNVAISGSLTFDLWERRDRSLPCDGSQVLLLPSFDVTLDNFRMNRSTFKVYPWWFRVGSRTIENELHSQIEDRLNAAEIAVSFEGFCPTSPPFLAPVQVGAERDVSLMITGCPDGEAADPDEPHVDGCHVGWAADPGPPDGGNIVRALVRPLDGAICIRGGCTTVRPNMQLRAGSFDPSDAIGPWEVRPSGLWSWLEAEVPYHKAVPPTDWPLDIDASRLVGLAARGEFAAQPPPPRESRPACVLGLTSLVELLDGGFPPGGQFARDPIVPGRPGGGCHPDDLKCQFVGRPLVGPKRLFTDTQTLSAELDDSPVLVSFVGDDTSFLPGDEKTFLPDDRVIVRPVDPGRGVELDLGERLAERLRWFCNNSLALTHIHTGDQFGPDPIDPIVQTFAPQILLHVWEEGFLPEAIEDLDGRLELEDALLVTGLGSRGEETDLAQLILDGGEKRTGAERETLGWVRFDAQGRVASRLDENRDHDTTFGIRTPDGGLLGPTLVTRLDEQGRWLYYGGSTPWPRDRARNALLGTGDMPPARVTYLLPSRVGRTEEFLGNHWTLDRSFGGAYAAYEPHETYRHRVGVAEDIATLDDLFGGRFALTVDPPATRGSCYANDYRRAVPVVQGRIDQVEVRATVSTGPTYRIDAGELFLGRSGPVGLPYLTGGGALAVGEGAVEATLLDVVSRGERQE